MDEYRKAGYVFGGIAVALSAVLLAQGMLQQPGELPATEGAPEPGLPAAELSAEGPEGEAEGPGEIAVLETTMGTIEIELDRENAPITVENFVRYVEDGFYDGTIFHRVIDGFMIQGGGFTPDGAEKETRSPIPLESQNGLSNMRGTIAMARTSVPDSATSQFFINVADNAMLDHSPGNPGYAAFGKVVSGMDVVDEIKSVPTGSRGVHSDWPVEDVAIVRAYMKGG